MLKAYVVSSILIIFIRISGKSPRKNTATANEVPSKEDLKKNITQFVSEGIQVQSLHTNELTSIQPKKNYN